MPIPSESGRFSRSRGEPCQQKVVAGTVCDVPHPAYQEEMPEAEDVVQSEDTAEDDEDDEDDDEHDEDDEIVHTHSSSSTETSAGGHGFVATKQGAGDVDSTGKISD